MSRTSHFHFQGEHTEMDLEHAAARTRILWIHICAEIGKHRLFSIGHYQV